LHLGQYLFTGHDFLLLEFEDDSTKPISDRRIKRSPLRDVASMIRSFDYALGSILNEVGNHGNQAPGLLREKDRQTVARWGQACTTRMSRRVVESDLEIVEPLGLLASNPDARRTILQLFLVERSITELIYDLTRRPDWATIPLQAILRMVGRD
jgi:maltose alpha-D-glucosyltransferase/alpha-amylase